MQAIRQVHIFKNTCYILGHSMGTTGYMVMANKHPELQDKIILANLLAPVAYVGDMKSPIRLIAPFADSLEVFLLTTF